MEFRVPFILMSCQVRVTVADSGLCCCSGVRVTYFHEGKRISFVFDCSQL